MRRIVAAVIVLAISSPAVALADKPEKGKGKGKAHQEERRDDTQVPVRFDSRQREVVRQYFAETYGRDNCPPGLAKKHNGCLPPGQAKKRYIVGRPLPPSVVVRELPREVSVRLGAPAPGYRYAIVDGDLVKLAVGTALVVDAIEGLVR